MAATPPSAAASGGLSDARQEDRKIGCLVCASPDVELFLDLGVTSLANKFLTREELDLPEPRYPLRVGFCHRCGHVQLMDRVPPAEMFSDYLYISSASDTLRRHFAELSATLVQRLALGEDDLVIDVGCNDASLLSSFRQHGVRTLGVDPAENLAGFGEGIERFVGFFGAESAPEIVSRWGQASLVTATNTFPHLPDLTGFVAGLDQVLRPGGAFVVEAHYLVDLLEQLAFDTVYHEHVSYWALGPMTRVFADRGLAVVRAERLPIHHGQLRVTVMRASEGEADESVADLLAEERRRGLGDLATYRDFAAEAGRIKQDLRRTLDDLQRQGKRVVAYGAPAKGSTLLEYLELGPQQLEYIADRSPLKQGRFTPGSHIPIVAPERLLEDRPDFVLLLAWNFVEEILEQQRVFREQGGRFILPVPAVRILE